MLRTLYSRLAAVLLGLCAVTGLLFLGVFWVLMDLHQQEVTQRLNSHLAEHLVSENLVPGSQAIKREALERMLDMLMNIHPGIEIYLLDAQGNVVGFSGEPGDVSGRRVDLRPVRAFLSGTRALPIRGDDPRDPDRRKIFSAARATDQDGRPGYLYVILGGKQYDSAAQSSRASYIFRLSAWTVGASVLFAALGGLFLFNALTRRVRRLAMAMSAFRAGKLNERVEFAEGVKQRGDELSRLGAAFNEMAEKIVEQMQTLAQTDRMRRELVANVSHDLRTPLASLQGYLETLILREDALPEQERRSYLEVALKHTERLGKLVAELVDLAKLDAGDRELQWEPVSLGELVQDIVQKFQLAAESRSIRLEASFSEDLPFVLGDIGLIERVFENLIENALRHTPAGGVVRVTLSPAQDRVTVQVADTGEGIPAEKIGRVFDRFYQVDKNEKEKSGRAGLGLAIVKRVVELHGGTIRAERRTQGGTTFFFSFPAHVLD
jgi:two-component system OmpR family sensor kinase